MGLAPMTGSVMKATHGTEPTMEGAVGTRRNHSGGVGLSQARLVLVGRRPSSLPVSWVGRCCSPYSVDHRYRSGQGRDRPLQRFGLASGRGHVLGVSKRGSVPPWTGTAPLWVVLGPQPSAGQASGNGGQR
jgi:hypothetical protein